MKRLLIISLFLVGGFFPLTGLASGQSPLDYVLQTIAPATHDSAPFAESVEEKECYEIFKDNWEVDEPSENALDTGNWVATCWDYISDDGKQWIGSVEARRLKEEAVQKEKDRLAAETERKRKEAKQKAAAAKKKLLEAKKREEERKAKEARRKREEQERRRQEAERKRQEDLRKRAAFKERKAEVTTNLTRLPVEHLEQFLLDYQNDLDVSLKRKVVTEYFVGTRDAAIKETGNVLFGVVQALSHAEQVGIAFDLLDSTGVYIVDVSQDARKKSGKFDFSVDIDLASGSRYLKASKGNLKQVLRSDEFKASDYIVIVDIVSAKTTTETTNTENITSEFRSGIQSLPNADYQMARLAVDEASYRVRDASNRQRSCSSNCQGIGCFVCIAMVGFIQESKKKYESAKQRLSRTPMTTTETLYAPYSFKKTTFDVGKKVVIRYFTHRPGMRSITRHDLSFNDVNQFQLLDGFHQLDRNLSQHQQGISSAREVKSFQEGPFQIQLETVLKDRSFKKTIESNVPDVVAYLEREILGIEPIAPQVVQSGDGNSSALSQHDALDLAFWQSIQGSDDPSLYKSYIRRFPSGAFVALASRTLRNLTTTSEKTLNTGLQFGRYHALVIGNNKYTHLRSLRTAVNDAKGVAAVLQDNYGFHVELVENATRSQIVSALSRLRKSINASDNLLIYYAGHGYLDDDVSEGYWLPTDAERDNPGNWVANSTLITQIRGMQAKHVMVVADSCFSGTIIRAIKVEQRGPNHLNRIVKRKARTALTSGGLEPVMDSGGGKHSAFASAFISLLEENDGVLDATQLFSQLRPKVMVNSPQTPEYGNIHQAGHDGGDFLFVRQ